MIPCGIIPSTKTVHECISTFLNKQAGISLTNCKNIPFLTQKQLVKDCIYPYDAQIEFVTKHERNVKLHYAFVYFLKMNSNAEIKKENVCFYSLEELEKMPSNQQLYSDLLERYKQFLQDYRG